MATKPGNIRSLCTNCIINAQTAGQFRTDHPCIDKDSKVYSNCFNRIQCEQLLKMEASQVIAQVLESGCLSCNFTPQQRKIMEVRLRGISDYLRVVQPKSKSTRRRHSGKQR